jgi:hypothetical protein
MNAATIVATKTKRFAVQVAQIENHNAFLSELGLIRFLLGINVS